MTRGIDISAYQTGVNYNMLKTSGIDFAILRAGYGKVASQKDKMFETHYKGCKDAGLNVGAYWYSYAYDENAAVAEARACIEILKGKQFEYPIYYDVEENNQYKLGKAKVSAIIKAFCTEMEKAGYWVGVYTNSSWYNNVISEDIKTRYAIWIAHWNVSKPTIAGPYGLWQYKVAPQAGINGDCDLDYGYVDYPTEIKKAGKNGYNVEPTPTPTPAKKTLQVSLTVDGIQYEGTLTEK